VKALAAVAIAVAAGGAVTVGSYAVAGRDEPAPPPAIGPGTVTVVVDIEHSRFLPSHLRVEQGTRVRFVVVNDDPINHELIVGSQSVHDRHRNGTEATHPPKPGELDEPGTVEMACHLPGHYDFGMHGEIEVVPAET
jgi:uncharacterized cupredoxin-like copper-binding protein